MFSAFDQIGRKSANRNDTLRLGLESLEKRQMLAATLAAHAGETIVGSAESESEAVFWQDRTAEIRRGQWVVQFDRAATAGRESDGEQIASAQAWLERRRPK